MRRVCKELRRRFSVKPMRPAQIVVFRYFATARTAMPQMLLIVEPIGQREQRGLEAGQAMYQRMLDFTAELRSAGALMMSSSLATAATRLQMPDGAAARVVDGPFAEAKEMIGGFFLLDCATREEALTWAARCPAAAFATVEVRETSPCYG